MMTRKIQILVSQSTASGIFATVKWVSMKILEKCFDRKTVSVKKIILVKNFTFL